MQKLTFTQLTESEIRQMMLEVAKEAVELLHRQQNNSDRPPFTRKEAAIHLGVSLPTLDMLIKTGQIKSFNIGRSVRIPLDEVNRFISISKPCVFHNYDLNGKCLTCGKTK